MYKAIYRGAIIFVLFISILSTNLARVVVSGEPGGVILPTATDETIESSENLELSLNSANGTFHIIDKEVNVRYESNPKNWEQDFIAQEIWRTALNSLLIVNYASDDGSITGSIDSYLGSVSLSESITEQITNGFRITYNFPKFGFSIPLEIVLENNRLKAVLLMKDVKVTKNFIITSISVLPFFGSATSTDKGYMIVPAGCGGIINLNNGRINANAFSDKIYAADTTLMPESYSAVSEGSRLPVFGMRKNNSGFMGIITKGESLGVINASISGYSTDNNNIYVSFDIASSESYSIKDSTGKSREFTVYDKLPLTDEKLEVSYEFLDNSNSTYAGMAKKYREYLITQQGIKENKITRNLLLDIYGAVVKKQSFLGFPINKTVALTTYDKALEIADSVKASADEKVTVSLEMATKKIINGEVADKIESLEALGGIKEFEKLKDSLGDYLFVSADPILYKSKYFTFSQYNKSAKTIMGLSALYKYYDLETNQVIAKKSKSLISPLSGVKALSRLFINGEAQKINLSLSSIGQHLYSDFGKDKRNRIMSQKIWVDAFSNKPKTIKKLMISKGNAYLLSFVSSIKDAPIDSGNSLLINDSIPFMQIALSGLVDLYNSSINLSANSDRSFIKSLEYGMGIHYSVIGTNSAVLKDTDLNWLYGADFEMWKQNIIKTNKKYQEIVKILDGSRLVDHKLLEKSLSESIYGNGVRIIFNYSDEVINYEDKSIPAQGYLLVDNS